jgi:uncharacterized metal-binding protein YceD (DUF177 family)
MEKINISNLHEGHHEFEFEPAADELNLGEIECKEVKVRVAIEKTGSQLVLDGVIEGKFALACDICTEKYDHEFSKGFEIAYKYDYTGVLANEAEQDDNIKFISPRTVYIDISDEVRDYVLLSVPMKAVPEVQNGICTFCGRDIEKFLHPKRKKEVNPVWEKLIKLKTKEE